MEGGGGIGKGEENGKGCTDNTSQRHTRSNTTCNVFNLRGFSATTPRPEWGEECVSLAPLSCEGAEDGQATVICGWALSGVELVLLRPLSTHPPPPSPASLPYNSSIVYGMNVSFSCSVVLDMAIPASQPATSCLLTLATSSQPLFMATMRSAKHRKRKEKNIIPKHITSQAMHDSVTDQDQQPRRN
ncbi:hypothetical protein Pmani_028210 [Petrolisthes manimaculis]|uniref:Uncharacterized protein n=1 Tax=Petrolisthes manimaculis TaxID=1843537 RepID=A0AAE1NZW5_9EUCA|nr:hypothetical protein Pmani_028210 [Petrolisthes manimaculis]